MFLEEYHDHTGIRKEHNFTGVNYITSRNHMNARPPFVIVIGVPHICKPVVVFCIHNLFDYVTY